MIVKQAIVWIHFNRRILKKKLNLELTDAVGKVGDFLLTGHTHYYIEKHWEVQNWLHEESANAKK